MKNFVITNISELVTNAPMVAEKRLIPKGKKDLGIETNAWLAVSNGKVVQYGTKKCNHKYSDWPTIDADHSLVMPGLVDCHTHPVFGGNRTHEFVKRLDGVSYQEIAAQGGGIQSTVRETRACTLEQLTEICVGHFQAFLAHGVTTAEAKSGYGLSVNDELKLLRAIKLAEKKVPLTIKSTCLALHAVPFDTSDKTAFISDMTDNLLPQVAREGLAQWVDAFVENGYFQPEECDQYFKKAKQLGLECRVHADEFVDSGAAAAAARWHAISADHLECASEEGIQAMAKAGTIAVILPGTSLYCNLQYTNARRFLEAGVPVAVASDFNPGSCRLRNLPFVASLAALNCGFRSFESIAAVTLVAAAALQLQDVKGALAHGFDADLAIYSCKSSDDWLADMGQVAAKQVFIGGHTCL